MAGIARRASILGLPSKTDSGRGTQITRSIELERLGFLEQQAEEAYDAMYEAHSPSHAAACYSDTKGSAYSAITVAQQLRAEGAVKRLEARLTHIKAVFR
jgi:hypothetical protein